MHGATAANLSLASCVSGLRTVNLCTLIRGPRAFLDGWLCLETLWLLIDVDLSSNTGTVEAYY